MAVRSKPRSKLVYVPMAADILHPGHLNIIREGQKLGEVVVGLLTDEAIAGYKRVPVMDYSQRYEVISSIKGVSRVVPQSTLDYRSNLRKFKPDYFMHGTDWRNGAMSLARQKAIDILSEWGGKLVEPDYTEGVSSSILVKKMTAGGTTPTQRQDKMTKILASKKTMRVMEAHNGLSGIIVENLQFKDKSHKLQQFDAIWISSLTDSSAKGRPDTGLVDLTSRLATINEILEVTTKPIIFDGDTGGQAAHLPHTIRTLERLGVSALVIEDKTGLKRNSLHGQPEHHTQESANVFAAKIKAAVGAKLHSRFMIIARIESLILGKGQKDALARAKTYIAAGADAIMIHSKDTSGADIKQFAATFSKLDSQKPLMVVPTSYSKTTEEELSDWGANIVVYANQLLRAAYPAMEQAGLTILKNHRSFEAESLCIPVKDFLKIIPES